MVTTATKWNDACFLEVTREASWQTYTVYYKAETSLCGQNSHSPTYGFSSSPLGMWELDHEEGWEPKNWCFRTVLLEKTLESPRTARRSNQSSLKEINFEYSLEGLMLKLKLQYFFTLMWRANLLEKPLMLERIEGRRRRGWQRMRWLDGIIDSMDMSLSKFWETVENRKACVLQSMDHKESDMT